MKIEILSIIELFEVILKHDVPTEVVLDVNNRINDWLSSGGKETDNYILNQCKYVENIINYKK